MSSDVRALRGWLALKGLFTRRALRTLLSGEYGFLVLFYGGIFIALWLSGAIAVSGRDMVFWGSATAEVAVLLGVLVALSGVLVGAVAFVILCVWSLIASAGGAFVRRLRRTWLWEPLSLAGRAVAMAFALVFVLGYLLVIACGALIVLAIVLSALFLGVNGASVPQ